MRPSLAAVHRWFAADVISDDTLAAYLSVLRADPNWRMTDMGGGAVRTLRLLYYPDGLPFDVVLDRTTDGWLPRVS